MNNSYSDSDPRTFATVFVEYDVESVEDLLPNQFDDNCVKIEKMSPNDADSTSSYLGSKLWESTIPFDPDCKDSLDYFELENFLNDNQEISDIKTLVNNLDDKNSSGPSSSECNQETFFPYFSQENNLNTSPDDDKFQHSSGLPTPTRIASLSFCNDSSKDSSCFSGFTDKVELPDKFKIESKGNFLKKIKDYSHGVNKKRCTKSSLRNHFSIMPAIEKKRCNKKSKYASSNIKETISIDERDETIETPKKSHSRKRKIDSSAKSEKNSHLKRGKSKKKVSSFSFYDSDNDSVFEDDELGSPKMLPEDSHKVEDEAPIPGADFNPCEHSFTEEELKPQPIITKGKKKYVPTDAKDEKYWARREKNNVAAKRSRDARRTKENKIVIRAHFLEDRHTQMENELKEAKKYIAELERKLLKYETI